MGDLKLKLAKNKQDQHQLTLSYSKKSSEASEFKDECVKAAKRVMAQNRNSQVILFLENTFESLVMLESFLEAKANFEVAVLSCGDSENPVLTNWSSRITKLGIKLNEIKFDYKNDSHIKELEKLQQQFDVSDMQALFNMWAICHFDQFVVLAGQFSIPTINRVSKVSSWGLPDVESLATYNFASVLGGEPFFLLSTHGLLRSQIESAFVAAYIELNVKERRGIDQNYVLKKIFYSSMGFKKLSSWPVVQEKESKWRVGLRFEGRDQQESVSKIYDKTKFTKFLNIKNVESIGTLKNSSFSNKNKQMKNLYEVIKKSSVDLNWNGGMFKVLENEKKDSVFAAFPLLVTQHFYSGSVEKLTQFLEATDFHRNYDNYISANDLHLKPETSDFIKFADEKIKMYFQTQGLLVYEYEITQCWANKASMNQFHHAHVHPNSIISGVFYLNDDGGGDTVFTKEAPELLVVTPMQSEPTPFNSLLFSFRPQKGKLILFPSFLKHQVRDHQNTDEYRYTIAFNVFIRGVIGDFNQGSWLDLRKK